MDKDIDKKLIDAASSLKASLTDEPMEAEEVQLDTSESTDSADSLETLPPSETSDDVKQDVKEEELDEKGVPYKNRYHEAVRKQARLEEELSKVTARLDQMAKQSEEQALTTLRGMTPEVPMAYPQPQQQQQQYIDEPAETATKTDVYRIVQTLTAKERNDKEALTRYPDLNNPSSQLFKETSRRIASKRAMGMNPDDPFLVLETAAAAYGDLVATGRLVPKTQKVADEVARRESVDAATVVTSRVAAKKQAEPKLTQMQAHVIKTFKNVGAQINPDDYLKRAKRYKLGE